MFDGVGWAAGEIVVFMVIATLIGLAIGWILGRWVQRSTIAGDFEGRINAEKSRADRAEKSAADSRKEIEKAQLELKAEQGRFAEMEGTADAGRADAADLEAIPSEAVKRGGEEPPTRDEGLARMSEIAARTAGDGPIPDDDLKKVHGIGPKMERTLKDLGLTSFRQIANLQPDDIVFVTAALGAFKGRIERDDWMSSAAEQHVEEYGEPA